MTKNSSLWLSVLGVVLGFALFFSLPGLAAAQTYPYADMPCVWAPYQIEGNRANWCADYDWGIMAGSDSQASTISPYGYAYRNCTDYVAWRLDAQGIAPEQYKGLGHAKEWVTRALNHGFRVDTMPAVGAVGVRTSGAYGHLAYIEAVYPDGRLKISQFNKQATGVYSEDEGGVAVFGFTAFIHFEEYGQAAVAPLADEPRLQPEAIEPEPAPASEPVALAEPIVANTTPEVGGQVSPAAEVTAAVQPMTVQPEPTTPEVQDPKPLPPQESSVPPPVVPQPETLPEPVPDPMPEPMGDPPPPAQALPAPPSMRLVSTSVAIPAATIPVAKLTAPPNASFIARYWPAAPVVVMMGLLRIWRQRQRRRLGVDEHHPSA